MTNFLDASWGIGALLSWGVADYLARSSSVRIGSLSTSLLVQVIGLVAPLALLAPTLLAGQDVDWLRLAWAAPLTAVFLAIGYSVYYTGLERGSVSVVSAVASAWLLVSVLIATVAFGERVSASQGVLIALILAGIVTLSLPVGGAHRGPSGLAYGVMSMLSLGVAFAMWKPLTEAAGPVGAVLSVRLLSGIAVWAYLRGRGTVVRLPIAASAWWLLAGAALLDVSGYLFYNAGLERAPLTVIAPLGAAHPLGTIALALILLRERPAPQQWLGMAMTVAGVITLSAVVDV